MAKKEKEFEWVLVETVDMFRMRYVVQVPKGKHVNALDTVVMHDAKEFSQKHLDETITSHRVISKKEALQMCIEDNQYGSTWSDEKIIDVFFTKEGEKADWS